ncbi:MAG: adenylosuccinate lyase family protein [Proteobacteria bacterium]|nr:adenylosuccinate lyase family protein [Pseudomonadota bacterium]
MPITAIDSVYFGQIFASQRMKGVFSDKGRFEGWVEMEGGLARAQGRIGMIPADAAKIISDAAQIDKIDTDAIIEAYKKKGSRIVPLVRALVDAVGPEAGRYVHWSSTTQDVIDTGLVLQYKKAVVILDEMLTRLEDVLADHCRTHRDTVMPGRTMMQQASPISFGHKAAIWLSEINRHHDRLDEIKPRFLTCQISGAVGNLATIGDQGIAMRRETAKELGLKAPTIAWHSSRDRWAEMACLLAMIGATLAKIGQEVAHLAHTEIMELAEPFVEGRGGSSTLPQKRNPILCQPLIAAGRMLRERAALNLDAMVAEHERPVGPAQIEYALLPEAFTIAGGALENALDLLDGLQVNKAKMRANLDMAGGMIMSEAVMMGLAPYIGRNEAHHVVFDACARANEEGLTLKQALMKDDLVSGKLEEAQIDALLEPSNYLGATSEMIDEVLEEVEHSRNARQLRTEG